MTRLTLSIATALIAASAFFSPAAQACISCEYVPEVLKAGEKKHARKQQLYVARPAPTPRKRIAKSPPARKSIEVAKAPAPKKIQTVKAPAPAPAQPVEAAKAEPAAPEGTAQEPTSKPVSTASLIEAGGAGNTEEPQAADNATSCKKFFPAVGMTLTVPCE